MPRSPDPRQGTYASGAKAHYYGAMPQGQRAAFLFALLFAAASGLSAQGSIGSGAANGPGSRASPAFGGRAYGTPLFSALGTRDGLPNASVSGIAQDAQGFLWFGTQGGLVRYDGYSFKLFSHAPFVRGSLAHDLVQTLYLERDALWAGTYGGL